MPQRIFICCDGVFKITHLLSNAAWEINAILAHPETHRQFDTPMRSQVCSLATASLWMTVEEAGATPLGGGGFGTTTGETI